MSVVEKGHKQIHEPNQTIWVKSQQWKNIPHLIPV